jgi:hypothetical protein
VYVIVHKELLFIPSLVLSLNIFSCGTGSVMVLDGSPPAFVDPETHYATGFECWSGSYVIIFAAGAIHLIFLCVFQFLMLTFTNDSYWKSQVPWGQLSIRPYVLNMIINISYAFWIDLDTESQYKIAPDVICLILSALIIVQRAMNPTLIFRAVRVVTTVTDMGRLIATLIVILHTMFQVDLNILELIMWIAILAAAIFVFV